MATNYGKWDRFVAELSDDDEDGKEAGCPAAHPSPPKPFREAPAGWGKPLNERGQIDRGGELTVGNAKGNALSTNAEVAKDFAVRAWRWTQTDAAVSVSIEVDPRVAGEGFAQDRVTLRVQPTSFALEVRDAQSERTLRFGRRDLPGVVPERCAFEVRGASGPNPTVVVSLAKRPPHAMWASCGVAAREAKTKAAASIPEETITDYAWSDGKTCATVYLRVPGIAEAAAEDVAVRFRELSFDASCVVRGRKRCFAVTELPMEIEVDKCSYVVKGDELRITLRKWARCAWFKLQVHR